jgi:mono/diheme cytochrome c family protein
MKPAHPAFAVLCACLSSAPSHALDSEQQRGKALLQSLCSRCHAIGRAGVSPFPDAPPFRTFGDQKLYDEDFAQRLQTGLSTIHKAMPSFQFGRADADAVASYLRAIQTRRKPR